MGYLSSNIFIGNIMIYIHYLWATILTSYTTVHHSHVSGVFDPLAAVALGSNPFDSGLTEVVPRASDVHGGVDIRVLDQTVPLAPLTAP